METSNRIQLINLKFGTAYKKAKMHDTADWRLFTNTVKSLVDAVKEFEALEIKSPIIKVGFSKQFQESMENVEKLQKSLEARGML